MSVCLENERMRQLKISISTVPYAHFKLTVMLSDVYNSKVVEDKQLYKEMTQYLQFKSIRQMLIHKMHIHLGQIF